MGEQPDLAPGTPGSVSGRLRAARRRASIGGWEWAVAPMVAGVGVLVAWSQGWEGVDFAAQVYRIGLFRAHGWLLWDNGWYGGHYLLPYSVLAPPLGAALTMYGALAASAVVAAWAFDRLVRAAFGTTSVVPGVLFAAGTLISVAIGQLPFLTGEALGLLALLAVRRRARVLAAVLTLSCPLMSPVAGAMLVLALSAWAIANPRGQRLSIGCLAGVAALPLLVLGVSFPQAGTYPFWGTDVVWIVALCGLGLVLVPTHQRALRAGLILCAAATVVLFVVPNPLGGNFVRLPVAVAPALVIAASSASGRKLAAVLVVPTLVWAWIPAAYAMRASADYPSAHPAYFQPLLSHLGPSTIQGRIEIPFTRDHWEAAYVAPHVALARGWERQTDAANNPIFYERQPLTAARYFQWLAHMGVEWVALPRVPLDYSSRGEAQLLAHPPSYLRLVWHDAHWRLWRVAGTPGIVTGPAELVSMSSDGFVVHATARGAIRVRIHYTRTWSVEAGRACLSATPEGWTRVFASSPGRIAVRAALIDHDVTCPAAPR